MSTPSPGAPLDSSQSRALLGITIVFSILATLAIAGRFYSRRLKRVSVGIDDWLGLAGLVSYKAHRRSLVQSANVRRYSTGFRLSLLSLVTLPLSFSTSSLTI